MTTLRHLPALLFLALALPIGAPASFAACAEPRRPPKEMSGEEADSLLKALLPKAGEDARLKAVATIDWRGDKRFIAPLIDVLRFVRGRDEYLAVLKTLQHLTGLNLESSSDPLSDLTVWYGMHTELCPPPGYIGWKGELHAEIIDPRFRDFLYDGAPSRVRVGEVVWGGVRVDGIPALVDPEFVSAKDATYLQDAEPVFGVSINGDNRAYPLRIMDWHEMANDIVGGVPVALAYCTLCGSGILYDARARGHKFIFGSSGFLFRSNKLMYDHETNTLWNQLTGEPVIGKLANSGIKLKVLPLVLTSWGEWRSEHPDTKVLSLNTGYHRNYVLGASYGAYFSSPKTMFPVWQRSKLLPAKASIFAIDLGGLPKAYPLTALSEAGGVVNDSLGSVNLVIVFDGATAKFPLPEDWAKEATHRAHHPVNDAGDLTAKVAEEVLKKHPVLSTQVTAQFLLAMPLEERLQLLTDRTADKKHETATPPGYFSVELRNEVALEGLIGETRAYDRGKHEFQRGPSPRELRDKDDRIWKVTEAALVGPSGEHLARLGGHLSFWFGWFAFYPETAVYAAAAPKPAH